MADPIRNTIKRIFNADSLTIDFLNEWFDDSLYITAHTSGSTGSPKAIKLLKSDMLLSAKATCEFFNITSDSNLVLPLSPNYIAGKMMIVRAIYAGAKLWIESPSNKPLIQDYGMIDLLPIVPSQSEWLTSGCKYIKNIRNLIIGGGVLSKKQVTDINNLKINAYATYGMTETCSHIALRHISSEIYQTLPNFTISIDNRNCLIIKSNEMSFKELATNDIVNLIDNNHFKWLGRYDNVINSGGIKIFPELIEEKLHGIIPYPFYITSEQDDKWGEIVVLCIESEPINTEYILDTIKKTLDKYQVPKKIIFIPQFSRTESGKIKRTKF